MATTKSFYFQGSKDKNLSLDVDVENINDLAGLKEVIGTSCAVVKPEGLSFYLEDELLEEISDIKEAQGRISIKVDGHTVRSVPGPPGLPLIGNYFEVFPDHLGNNQRLFDKYGPIFSTNNMGSVVCQTNDPELADVCFAETEFFSKEINSSHPLYPIKQQQAGVFLADTSAPAWKVVHKFLPPALGPKAVRHYAPEMNGCCNEAFPVFDKLESENEAWNVYQFMLKLSSGAIGKIMLGQDFEHFSSVDAPLHKMVLAMAEVLSINKKIASRGEWYSHLPFGDPARLKNLQSYMAEFIETSIKNAKSNGTEDLPLQDAALKASNVIDYLVRATDSTGKQLPKENLMPAVTVACGAGFTTTSSLLSWCIYALVTYPGIQAQLLQELVDNDINDSDNITAEQIDELPVLANFIKEAQRRHNPSYQPGRTAQKDLILPGGYQMKKGTVVICAIHHIHNNPKNWDNPDKFDPDRWNHDPLKGKPKSAYAPFAQGGRMCVGFNFALLEVKIFMCKLVYRYHWDKEGDMETSYDPFFQLIRPVDLYVKTTKRQTYPTKSGEGQA
ncbi:unnamed protein product [Zymoseptoria tritici ST99CH_1E4]|uniref:Cytochrome P450 monooxygenase n=1 Tax=Zymoseptoria tritici ST99CH_1E4 TaxID=1276532 RepID=A0A2H1GAP8_ZYMTR|nr:unnamed protein product [Zymoseptoria tritici ST99CH_1E4]